MPTPVSSLLHAATLVIAGIYLVIRSSYILEFCTDSIIFIGIIGSITSIFASFIGVFQLDIKRIIAYSTISQIGYLYIASGISYYNVSIFHMINHSFFKSLLFICAGILIHSSFDLQDIRKFGGYRFFIPIIYIAMIIASFALMAVPSTTGFYSKDLIIEISNYSFVFNTYIFYICSILAAFITSFYSFKIIIMVFFYFPNSSKFIYYNIHDLSIILYIPVIFLSICSIIFGYIFSDIFIGFGSDIFNNSIFVYNVNYFYDFDFDYSFMRKFIPFAFTIISSVLSIYVYHYISISINSIYYINNSIYSFVINNFYLDVIVNKYILFNGFNFAYYFTKFIDQGLIEIIGPAGIYKSIVNNNYNSIFNPNINKSNLTINFYIYY